MRGRWRNAIPAPALPHRRWRWRIRPGASLPGKRSRIISPKPDLVREKRHSPPCNFGVCSAVNTNFLPNLLTFGMKSAENRPRKASPFPLRPRRIPPVSRHCGKLPKILTFHRRSRREHPASSRPIPHGQGASSRKSSPRGPESAYFARFRALAPEKLHLRPAFFPDSSHPTCFSPSI